VTADAEIPRRARILVGDGHARVEERIAPRLRHHASLEAKARLRGWLKPMWHPWQELLRLKLLIANGCVPGIRKSRNVVGNRPPGSMRMVNTALLESAPTFADESRART
jgi:hypothetical protein